jgi:hypothetical protein
MFWRFGVIALAAGAAFAPIPPDLVERVYSSGVYPPLQRALTGVSNRTSLALFDVACVGLIVLWLGAFVLDVTGKQRGWAGKGGRLILRTVVLAAVVYLAFLVTWGFNYRRPSLGSRLGLDPGSATSDAALTLASTAVGQLNALHGPAHAAMPLDAGVDLGLADAFSAALTIVGAERPAQPARPKVSLLDGYFRAAGVDGLTAPFFAETLLPSDLLDVERPVVVAHEWSHLAGFADEGEAGFVAWLTCLGGTDLIRYSGWLSLLSDAVRVVTPAERDRILAALGPGPVSDLRAMGERRRRNVNPTISRTGWRVYDRYLRANRVESGTASYDEALQLALGTEVGRRAWRRRQEPASGG